MSDTFQPLRYGSKEALRERFPGITRVCEIRGLRFALVGHANVREDLRRKFPYEVDGHYAQIRLTLGEHAIESLQVITRQQNPRFDSVEKDRAEAVDWIADVAGNIGCAVWEIMHLRTLVAEIHVELENQIQKAIAERDAGVL